MTRVLAAGGCAAVLALAPPLAAQPVTTAPGADQSAVTQRIAMLQARLAITPAEQPAWTSFTEVMRDNAATTDQLFAQRAAQAASMTAPQNMRSYAVIARAYADNTSKLADAFTTLYAKLSPAQKQAADALFRQTQPMTGRR